MDIPIDEEWLKALYTVLIAIYKDSDNPIRSGFPIVTDYDQSILIGCVNKPKAKIFGKTIYPHTLQRAAVIMYSIINFHPFVDGNKRAALLSAKFYLLWNGYNFTIPVDADDFTIEVAKGKKDLNDILFWLKRNSKRTPFSLIRHWLCSIRLSKDGTVSTSKVFADETLRALFVPIDGLIFFRDKIVEEKIRKTSKA
jgi:death-on-curing protein